MAFVPRKNWHLQPVPSGLGSEKLPVVEVVPVPPHGASHIVGSLKDFDILARQVRDEIDRKSELVRTLPRSRFCHTFDNKARLPSGVAERLEDFERGLRDAGLVSGDQILLQSFNNPLKFRVK